jgi:hypothetical protein
MEYVHFIFYLIKITNLTHRNYMMDQIILIMIIFHTSTLCYWKINHFT